MSSKASERKNTFFIIAFLVLTVLCWCPLGYGRYGEVGLIMGIPSWAFFMLVSGAILFVIEWVYLFKTDLALYDEDLDEIMKALETLQKTTILEEK